MKRVNQGTKTDEALRLARKITAEIEALIVGMYEDGQTLAGYNRLLDLLTELDQIEGELDLSCELIGMLSPWSPQVRDGEPTLAQMAGELVPFTSANDPELWTWPSLNASLEFLKDQEILSTSEWNNRVRDAETKASQQPIRIRLESQVEQFRQHLREGLAAGDSVEQFKKRVKPTIESTDATIERNFRTSSKRAYLDGVQKVTNTKTFPFVKYVATKDNRTRASHRVMDGRILEVGTPEYDHAVDLQREYNCRCTLIPLTDKQAEREGVKQPDLNIEFDKAEEGKVVSNSYVGRVTSHKGVIYKIAKDEAIPQEEVRLQEIASRRGLAPKVYQTDVKDGEVKKLAMENVRKTAAANLERTTGGGGVEHGTRPLQSLLELNQEGIAHRDLHGGNVRWQPSTGKAVFFDFEKATLDRDQAEWEAGQTLRGFIDYQRNRDLTTEQEQALDRLEPLIRDEVDNEGHPAWRLSTVDIPRAKELLEAWNR